jgi:hypothetical protein
MPTRPKPDVTKYKFKAWSYSRWKDHFRCPYYALLRHLVKLQEPKSPALERGGEIDRLATDYLIGKARTLPAPLKLFRAEFARLRKVGASAQTKWAVDRSWRIVDFFDWDRAWGRVVLDSHFVVKTTADVIDFKTGKVYPENEEQLELYAVPTFIAYPLVKQVKTSLWYLDQGEINGERTYTRELLPTLIKRWEKRLVPMLTDRKFTPKPGDYCRRCHFRQSNGGPCKY